MLSIEELLYGRKGVQLRAEHRPHLQAIEHEASQLEAQQARLAAEIRKARDADVPFRAIAAAARISHEQARRIARSTDR